MADRAFLAEGEDSWLLQALKESNRTKSGVSTHESEEKGWYEDGPQPVTPETLALAYLQLLHKAKQTSGTGQPDNLTQRQQSDGRHQVHLMTTQGGAYFTIQKPGGAMPHDTVSPQRLPQHGPQQQPLFPPQEDNAVSQHLAKFSYLALLQGDLSDLLSIRAAEIANNRRHVKVSKWRKLLIEARKMLVRRRAVAAVIRSRRDSFDEPSRPGTVAMMRGLGCCVMVALLALLLCLDRHRLVPSVVRELGHWGESGKAGLGAIWGGEESSKAMEMKLANTATRPSATEPKVSTALGMHADSLRTLEEAFLSAASQAAASSSPPEPTLSAMAATSVTEPLPAPAKPASSAPSETPAEADAAAAVEEPALADDESDSEASPLAQVVPIIEATVLQAVNAPVPSVPSPSTPTLPAPASDGSASPSVSHAAPSPSAPPPVGEAAGEEPDPLLPPATVVEAAPSAPLAPPSSLDAPVEARPDKREDPAAEDAPLSGPPRQTARQLAQGAALRLSALPRLLRNWCFYPAAHLQAINARLSFSNLPWRRRRASEEAIAAVLSGSQLVTVASARQLQLSRGMATEKLERLYHRAFIEEEMTLLEALAICGLDQVMRAMELRWLQTQEWLAALLEDWEDEEMHLQRRQRIQGDGNKGPRCPGAASAKEHVACWLRGLVEVLARQGKRIVIRTKEYLSQPAFPLLHRASII